MKRTFNIYVGDERYKLSISKVPFGRKDKTKKIVLSDGMVEVGGRRFGPQDFIELFEYLSAGL